MRIGQNGAMDSKKFRMSLPVLLVSLGCLPACAATDPVVASVDQFLRTETRGLPGRVSWRIDPLDPRTQLPACSAFEPFTPTGGRLWGNATVGVRCLGPSSWVIYVPVKVSVVGEYVVPTRPLPAGLAITTADLAMRSGDLTDLPAGVVTDPAQAVGRIPRNGIGPGQPLRTEMLNAPLAVQQGQSVKLLTRGAGFSASSEGKALNNAAEGQVVQVRTPSGQVVSGVARTGGTVEVTY